MPVYSDYASARTAWENATRSIRTVKSNIAAREATIANQRGLIAQAIDNFAQLKAVADDALSQMVDLV